MIQSITFFKTTDDILTNYFKDPARGKAECINTWDDWHILASSRPVFVPPQVKMNYIDVPGGNGSLDLSESLTRYPTYENRSGSFKFRVMNGYRKDSIAIYESNDTGRWAQRYSEIMEYIHGRHLYAVLADDPLWFYQGRFSVESWDSADTWSEITIGYNVNPYKWSIFSSADSDWLWDPFNFETGIIRSTACKDIQIDSPDSFGSVYKLPPRIPHDNSMQEFFGGAPISPTITFHSKCPVHDKFLENKNGIYQCPVQGCGKLDAGIDIRFINEYLNIDIIQHFTEGTTFAPDFLFYGKTEPYELYFKGCGTVSIDFRIGRL